MIQTTEVSITYKGDGVQTLFSYPYPYRSSEDIVGYIVDESGHEERITTNFKYDNVTNMYQYPLAGDPLAAPNCLKLIRETPQQQNADLPGKLPFSLIEKSLDWIIMILQEIGSKCNNLWHVRNDCRLSETNARNSASAAAESETNAADSEEMAKKWAEYGTSPDGAADTDSPTGYTQSAKIWAALSKEYAGMSKFKLPIAYYNSVGEMKASETALAGRPCVTLGYYRPNDGGGSVYLIRAKTDNDTDDGGSIIALDNGNVAELLVDGEANVKQFGAKGDGATDDTKTIEATIVFCVNNKVRLYFSSGKYNISHTLQLTKPIQVEGEYPNEHGLGSWLHPTNDNIDVIAVYCEGVSIKNIGIAGNAAGSGTGIILGKAGAMAQNALLSNILVTKMGNDGITLASANNTKLQNIKVLYNQGNGFAIRTDSDNNYSGNKIEIINAYGNGGYGALIGGEGNQFYIVSQHNTESNICMDNWTNGCTIIGYTEYSKTGYEIENRGNCTGNVIIGTYRSKTGKQYYNKTGRKNIEILNDGTIDYNVVKKLGDAFVTVELDNLAGNSLQTALKGKLPIGGQLPIDGGKWSETDSGIYLYNGWDTSSKMDGMPNLTRCTGICIKYINLLIGSVGLIITDTGKIAINATGTWKIFNTTQST